MKIGTTLKVAYSVLAETFAKWNEHKAVRLGAALAYFAIFAIAPVLIIAMGIAGLCVLMLASLLLSAGLNAVGLFLGSAAPGEESVCRLADFVFSFGLVTLLSAGIFKFSRYHESLRVGLKTPIKPKWKQLPRKCQLITPATLVLCRGEKQLT